MVKMKRQKTLFWFGLLLLVSLTFGCVRWEGVQPLPENLCNAASGTPSSAPEAIAQPTQAAAELLITTTEVPVQSQGSSSVVEKIISIAIGEIGTCGDKAHSRYGSNIDGDWCATFITWVSRQAGASFSHSKKANPSPGDKVLYDFGNYGHVDIVVSVNPEKNTFTTVGGNVNDCVAILERPLGSSEVVGFYAPR